MGFKFKRVDLTCGSSDFPHGDTNALRQTRAASVVKACAQAIIDCNCGWALDTTKNATINDTVAIPSRTSGTSFPGLFLTNSTSGCKLFLAYFGHTPNYGIKDFSGTGTSNLRYVATAKNSKVSGLCMSMIPAGSSSTFGDPTTTTFLPDDATRIIGTVNYDGANGYTFGSDPSEDYVYTWGMFVTPYCICVANQKEYSTPGDIKVPAYAVGRVIGTLSHSEDNTNQAKYGCINFRQCDSDSDYEGSNDNYVISFAEGILGTYRETFGVYPYVTDIDSFVNYTSICGAISKADGSWINGCNKSTFDVIVYPSDICQTGSLLFNTSSNTKTRWTPFVVASVSTNLNTNGVVAGDGMKGYLDTDLFRGGLGTYGQTYDNGNFICVDDRFGFLMGWDSTNTDTIS